MMQLAVYSCPNCKALIFHNDWPQDRSPYWEEVCEKCSQPFRCTCDSVMYHVQTAKVPQT